MTLAWDEVPLPSIPGTVARSLLAFLLTYRDRPHTRDLLAGTFWPDLPAAPPLGDQTKTPPSER